MKKNRIIIMCILLLSICISVEAQRSNRRTLTKTTHVQKQTDPEKEDTVVTEPKRETPKYRSLSDPMVVKYLSGGFAKENKLHLITNAEFAALSDSQKREVLGKVAHEFAGYDMLLYTGGQQRELWMADGNSLKCIEKWNNDSLQIERYLPLELKRQGETKVFYYVGGMLNGSEDNTSYSLNLRVGSYLYKNLIDASVTLNLGGNKTKEESQFTGDVGADTRVYLPFRIKEVNLAPYAGIGLSWIFKPERYFELRFLGGGCWFVGPGSLDIGLQYGTKTKMSVSLGYTFRIPIKKKKK